MKKISALSKRPGQQPRHVWVSNNLEAMQEAMSLYTLRQAAEAHQAILEDRVEDREEAEA